MTPRLSGMLQKWRCGSVLDPALSDEPLNTCSAQFFAVLFTGDNVNCRFGWSLRFSTA